MGLYQPRNLIPYLQSIDATQSNTFSCQINGTKCIAYKCDILSSDNISVYSGSKTMLTNPLYNGEILSFPVETSTLTNGNDYKWKIRLYQNTPTMLVGYGTTTGCKVDSIAITPPTASEKETINNVRYKHIKIGSETKAVSTYDTTLNRFTMSASFSSVPANGTSMSVYDSDENGDPRNIIYTGTCINSTTTTVCMKPNTYTLVGHVMKINGVSKTITSFDSNTWVATLDSALSSAPIWGVEYQTYSDFIDSNPESPFYARADASVTITNLTDNQVITNRAYEFSGLYYRLQNVELKYHKWKLWVIDENNVEKLLKETEDIYSADLKLSFNEFKTGLSYKIQLLVEDEYDKTFSSPVYTFSVLYANPDTEIKPLATFLPDKTAINVRWGNSVDYTPTITPSYTITYYSNGTYTKSNEINRVYSTSTNEFVSTTVDTSAIIIRTQNITNYEILDGSPSLGLKSLRLNKNSNITWQDWIKEDRTGVLNTPETFCISWYQKFNTTFSGDIINFQRLDDDNVTHTYRIWITEETDLTNKYKFLYNLDGTTGEYVWDIIAQNYCLQVNSTISSNEDYIYADTLNGSNQMWLDAYYFVENGTRGIRLNKYWWKFIMTKDEVIIQKGSD